MKKGNTNNTSEAEINFKDKYFNFWYKVLGFEKRIKILEVDFQKPWWQIIWDSKLLFVIIYGSYGFSSAFWYVFPILLATLIERNLWELIPVLFLVRMISLIFDVLLGNIANSIFQNQIISSTYYHANLFFIKTDPNNHSTRSSGQIISKTQRGSSAYESLLDILLFNIQPIVIAVIVLSVAFLRVDFYLFLIMIVGIGIQSAISISLELFNNSVVEPKNIAADDKVKEVTVENLQQTAYIRALFASQDQSQKFQKVVEKSMRISALRWSLGDVSSYILIIFYYIFFLAIIWRLYGLNLDGIISNTEILGITGTFIVSTNSVLGIGKYVRRIIRSQTQIQDLFDFINNYGQQTFAVLPGDEIENSNNLK